MRSSSALDNPAPPLARRLAGAGMKVAIIERHRFGGTCVNTGCTPTKTLVASAYAAHMARRGADYGVNRSQHLGEMPMASEVVQPPWRTVAILVGRLIFAGIFVMAAAFKFTNMGGTASYIAS